jgi:hypothetical protein
MPEPVKAKNWNDFEEREDNIGIQPSPNREK